MTTLRFSHTHLYAGALGRTAGPLPEPGEATGCTIAFADGTETPATLSREADALVLNVSRHTTARGTDIPAKRWSLVVGGRAGADTLLRVAARLPGP